MPSTRDANREHVDHLGFTLVREVFSDSECTQLIRKLEFAQSQNPAEAFRSSRGTVFAARNVLRWFPQLLDWWPRYPLPDLLKSILGNDVGLVRVLYFDKPSHRSWSLPFHKDMTVAVKDNQLPSRRFTKPTSKAGVDHVEAPASILCNMLTLRIHLDSADQQNGCLQVIPGSHRSGKQLSRDGEPPVSVECRAGDVLAIRPLVSHASAHSQPGSKTGHKERHRRILHLEFSGDATLPDGYEWHTFERTKVSN